MNLCMYLCMYVCMCVTYVCMHACMYVCMHACMYVRMYYFHVVSDICLTLYSYSSRVGCLFHGDSQSACLKGANDLAVSVDKSCYRPLQASIIKQQQRYYLYR